MLTLHSNISTISNSTSIITSINMQGIKLSSYSDVVKNTMLSSVRKRMLSIEMTSYYHGYQIMKSKQNIIITRYYHSSQVHALCIDSIPKNINHWRQNNNRAEIYAVSNIH